MRAESGSTDRYRRLLSPPFRMTGRNKHIVILLVVALSNVFLLAIYLMLSNELRDTLMLLGLKDGFVIVDGVDDDRATMTIDLRPSNISNISRIFNLNNRSLITARKNKSLFHNLTVPVSNSSSAVFNVTVPTPNNSAAIDEVITAAPKLRTDRRVSDEYGLNEMKSEIGNALRFLNGKSNGKVDLRFLINNLNLSIFFQNSNPHLSHSSSSLDNPIVSSSSSSSSDSPIIKQTKTDEEPFFEEKPFYSRIDFMRLQKNPIYAKFRIMEAKKKKRVHIVIIVTSAPRRVDRRMAIRKTWWKMCKPTNEVIPACIFRTDFLYPGENYYQELQDEASRFNDMTFQHAEGGINFGDRFLNHMLFAVSNYEFEYFLRIDDDYFLCLQNFLNELPLPMEKEFLWGWIHPQPGIVRPDVGIVLLSRDLLETFLLQDYRRMLCNPLADQMIGDWSNTINLRNTYRSDPRLHHDPPARDVTALNHRKNICHAYIGLHGSYPAQMIRFWKNRGDYKPPTMDLVEQSHVVPIRRRYNYMKLDYYWRYKSELCFLNPTWDTVRLGDTHGYYVGRQG